MRSVRGIDVAVGVSLAGVLLFVLIGAPAAAPLTAPIATSGDSAPLDTLADPGRTEPGDALLVPAAANEGLPRLHRGGCWCSAALGCRSAQRSINGSRTRSPLVGFRVVLGAADETGDAADMLGRPPLTNGIGMRFKLLPPGTFTMGESAPDRGRTAPRVTIARPFHVGVHEVTNAQWKRVMGTVPSRWPEDDQPVEHVSWHDAVEFCRRLSALPDEQAAGREYRLPTEAEWEYACRAGENARYTFGDEDQWLDEYGWFDHNSGARGDSADPAGTGAREGQSEDVVTSPRTHPVGRKRPNAWGLFDMHGNVSEWCADDRVERPCEPLVSERDGLWWREGLTFDGVGPVGDEWLAAVPVAEPPALAGSQAAPAGSGAERGALSGGMAALALAVPVTLVGLAIVSRAPEGRLSGLTWFAVWLALLFVVSGTAAELGRSGGDLGVPPERERFMAALDLTVEVPVAIPEPSAAVLALAGLGCCAAQRWRQWTLLVGRRFRVVTEPNRC